MLKWLEKWYLSNCDGDWEHCYQVKIGTLDNPGWTVNIDLIDTDLEDKTFNKIKRDFGDNDWIICYVKDNVFRGDGSPDKLEEILKIFKEWAES